MFFPIRSDRRLTTTPWVNYALIIINVAIFAYTQKLDRDYHELARSIAVLESQINEVYAKRDFIARGQRELAIIEQRLPGLSPAEQRPLLQRQKLLVERLPKEIEDYERLAPRVPGWEKQRQAKIDRLQTLPRTDPYYYNPQDPQLYQLLSYQFLHIDLWHLLGNMIFLFIFGNGVEDRLGKLGYLFFYLAGGVLAGVGHGLTSNAPVLGASGAVSAVTGAYLALFPLSVVTIIYFFGIIGTFEVSSMILILFRVGQDVVFQLVGFGSTAYMAHLAGYFFGFAAGMGLLMGRVLPREPYDMLALIEQRRRRSQFRRLTDREGFHPWESGKPGSPPKDVTEPATPEEQALMDRRGRISAALADHDLPEAARRYVELLEDHPDQVMGQQQQLDIANQLMSEGWYDHAAAAYELFLTTYRAYSDRHQVQLILGLIHARYLENPDRAKTLLTEALPKLTGDEQQLAEAALKEIGSD